METTTGSDTMNESDVLDILILFGFIDIIVLIGVINILILINYVIFQIITGGIK